jgi:hypothetical protein
MTVDNIKNVEDTVVAFKNVKTSGTRNDWERREGFLIVRLWEIIHFPTRC